MFRREKNWGAERAKNIKRAKKATNAPNSGIFLNSSKDHLEGVVLSV